MASSIAAVDDHKVPIIYSVSCGKFDGPSELIKYEFSESAPASLCIPKTPGAIPPDADEIGLLITPLIDKHNSAILKDRPWRCVICDKKANDLLHSALPALSAGPSAGSDFVSTVLDFVSPICFSGGACDAAAEEMTHRFSKGFAPWMKKSKTCDACGKKSGLKLCAGCKLLAYCSKECQAKRWPTHKKNCKQAQLEQTTSGRSTSDAA
ncbi:hypothetical protein BDZ45DRAFT_692583 [Acephala macrosclerotiorum]|nr:hypothetical protein BDZ45DRAFT_692583 [Acephala macrosclerotiorum]